MATVRASCPDCGEVELGIDQVQARLCVDDGAGSYAFRCPGCRVAAAKPAGARVVHLLVTWGAPLTMWRLPEELSESRHGPPLTHDDLLSFHQELADDRPLPRSIRIDDR
ncbi:MAG: hypothetical protein M3N25_02260 [Actinomycetota bacterium]|nr:hypothetical protein [Actinomycetota bacterium]MDP9019620.1 hypothetical protein [Actinomycetota bacterium]